MPNLVLKKTASEETLEIPTVPVYLIRIMKGLIFNMAYFRAPKDYYVK
jgi:hypothetical protein